MTRTVTAAVCLATIVSLVEPVSSPADARVPVDHNRPKAPLGKVVQGRAAAGLAARAVPASSRSATAPTVSLPAAGTYTVALGSLARPAAGPQITTAAVSAGSRGRAVSEPAARVSSRWFELGGSGIAVAAARAITPAGTGPTAGGASSGAGPAAAAAGQTVSVSVLSAAAARQFGLTGLVLRIARAKAGAGPVAVKIADSVFSGLYGADYADRVRWVQLPDANPTSTATQHAITPVAHAGSGSSTVLTPQVGSAAVLVAADASGSGATGSFTATSLKSSSSWAVSAQTGDFSWSYPMRTPPAAAGPAPSLGLGYDSQSVDGETGSTNNQPDEIGDGWSLSGAGYIETTYTPCSQISGASGGLTASSDLCFNFDNATINLAGHSGQLVKDSSGTWKLAGDDGSRVEHLSGTANGCGNATYDDDCWRLTTTDGTQYYFGRNELPGWASGKPTTNSAWTVPVCGTAATACSGSTEAVLGPFERQAWRWNLDYVVDPHDNAEALYYTSETNEYRQQNSTVVSYTRSGYLDHIDYGLRASDVYGSASPWNAAASDKVVFTQDTYGRCEDFSSKRATSCTAQDGAVTDGVIAETKPATPANYPDTPYDQWCTASPCTGLVAPTFWSGQMLSSISTEYWTGSAYAKVDTWTLGHSFPVNGEVALGNAPAEWLTDIAHTGYEGSASLTLPDVKFAGISMPNRVDSGNGMPELWKYRINTITNETGAQTLVGYSAQACDPSTTSSPLTCGASLTSSIDASPQTNTALAYPQWWTPDVTPAIAPQEDLFNKYVVTAVDNDPVTGGTIDPEQQTQYIYHGNPAWRFDTDPGGGTDEQRTWSVFAGYPQVEVRVGDPSSPASEQTTDYTFFQGRDGDPDGSQATPTSTHRTATTTPASDGSTVTDAVWLAGQVRETIVRVGANGGADLSTTPVLSDTINTPWASAATATSAAYSWSGTDPTSHASYSGSVTLTAHLTGAGTSKTITPLAGGGSRTVTTTTTHESTYGLITKVEVDTPDVGDTCTSTSYAMNTSAYLIAYPDEVDQTGVGCAASATYPGDAISDVRTRYDGQAWGDAPTTGDATETDVVKSYTGTSAASAVWLTKSTSIYDALGRPTAVTDALGNTTHTAYTPAGSGPLTQTVVTSPAPFDFTTTTTYNPEWGSSTSTTDPNAKVSTESYDALGRLSGVWDAAHPYASNTSSPATSYAYVVSQTAASSVATTTLNANGTTMTSYTLYDGLGRVRQTQTGSESLNTGGSHIADGTVLTDTGYDAAGRVVLTDTSYYTPIVNPSGTLFVPATTLPGAVKTGYDGAGRPTVSIQLIDGTEAYRSTTSYQGGDETDTVPPAGGTPTATFTNSLGKTSKLVQYLSSGLSGTTETTSYGYNPAGELTSLTNPAGEHWRWAFNPLGQQTSASDPDTGTTTTTYDNDGNLASTTDAAGNTLKYSYDQLGRKTSEAEGDGTQLAAWTYDPTLDGVQYKDQAGSATEYVGGTPTTLGAAYTSAVTGYDADYRSLGTATTVPAAVAAQFGLPTTGASYTTTASYNVDGSLNRTVEPAAGGIPASTLTRYYTPLDQLYALGGVGDSVIGDTSFTHTNQLAQLDLTNGTTEVDRTYTYQDGTNRLTNLLTTTSASTNIHPETDAYIYNDAGEITSDTDTADAVATDTQCYRYDDLQDLTDAWTPASNSCTATPTSASLGGPAPYWTSYAIDPATGNRSQSVEHATTTAGTDTRDSYTYPATSATPTGGNGGANAVETITHASATAGTDPTTGTWTTTGTDSYTYNADGSTTATPGQSLAYNSAGQQTSTTLTSGTHSGSSQNDVYDATGTLIYQSDPVTGATLYLGDTELHVAAGATTVTGVRTFSADGIPLAERSTNPAGTVTDNWLCANNQGTSTVEINAQTLAVTRRYEDPYGNPRTGTPTSWSSTNNYLNAAQNTFTNTTTLGARTYNPTTGRFLTVDPLLEAGSPQQLNGYAYAANNPTNTSDPTGQCPKDICGDGGPAGTPGSAYTPDPDPAGAEIYQQIGSDEDKITNDDLDYQKIVTFEQPDNHAYDYSRLTLIVQEMIASLASDECGDEGGGGEGFGVSCVSAPVTGGSPDRGLDYAQKISSEEAGNALNADAAAEYANAQATAKDQAQLNADEQAADTAADELPGLTASRSQLEAKFKHAADFGVTDSRGAAGFDAYGKAVDSFVNDSSTVRVAGTYRGDSAILNYNATSRLVVVQGTDGSFISGWQMSQAQLQNVMTRGSLGGG